MKDLSDKTSQGLASIVVAYRAFGFFKKEAREAMSELLLRKDRDNDPFDYETFIAQEIEKLPKPTVPNELVSMLKTFSTQGFK